MALLFSAVTVTANDDKIELLVSGIPRECDEIEGWTDFDDFVNLLHEESEVSVHAEGYLYGEGEIVDAYPQEVAYFLNRMETDEVCLLGVPTKSPRLCGVRTSSEVGELLPFYGRTSDTQLARTK